MSGAGVLQFQKCLEEGAQTERASGHLTPTSECAVGRHEQKRRVQPELQVTPGGPSDEGTRTIRTVFLPTRTAARSCEDSPEVGHDGRRYAPPRLGHEGA